MFDNPLLDPDSCGGTSTVPVSPADNTYFRCPSWSATTVAARIPKSNKNKNKKQD